MLHSTKTAVGSLVVFCLFLCPWGVPALPVETIQSEAGKVPENAGPGTAGPEIPESSVRGANSGVTVEVNGVVLDLSPPNLNLPAGKESRYLTLELGFSNRLPGSFYEIICPEDQLWLIADRTAKMPIDRKPGNRLKPFRVPAGKKADLTLRFPLEGTFMSLEFMLVDSEWGDIFLPLVSVGEKGFANSPGFEYKPLSLSGFTFGIVSLSRLRSDPTGTTAEASKSLGTTIRLVIRNEHKVPRIMDSRGLTSMGNSPGEMIEGHLVCGPEAHPAGPHDECPGRGGDCRHLFLLPGIPEVFRFDFPMLDPKDPKFFSIRGEFGSILQVLERP